MNDFILGIESSCDETAVCIMDASKNILSHRIASQIKTHAKHGGVVPELASRQHARIIHSLVDNCLSEAALQMDKLSKIAVTKGPGLEGALLVGITYAKTLAHCLQRPLIGVNHLHGHIYAAFLNKTTPTFPFVALIVSGGHTQLVLVKNHFQFNLLGQTRDDAAGEAFDKVARVLNLGYPGGPIIDKLAKTGEPTAFNFPRAMIKRGLEFSFSGLKTAVIQTVRKLESEYTDSEHMDSEHTGPELLSETTKANIAASFQAAVVDILVHKCLAACQQEGVTDLVVCGGVSANSGLKAALENACNKASLNLFIPPLNLCTDNAAMIAVTGYYMDKYNITNTPIEVNSSLSL